MTDPIDPELARVYASAPYDRTYVETIELSHPLFSETRYLTRAKQAWQFALEPGGPLVVFLPVAFEIQLPARDGKGQQDLQLVLDNVGREAMDEIERAAADPTINIALVYRVYVDIPDSAPARAPIELALQSITVKASAIVGTATRADVLNRPFPSELYRVDLFPGLNR